MYKISHEVINFIEKIMKTWRVELTAGGRSLAETKIQRGIFQGDALSTLLFITATMVLNNILRKCMAGYKLSRSQDKIKNQEYMDYIKQFAKTEKALGILIHTVRIYSQYIGMEFCKEKCAMIVMKSGKQHMTEEWNYQIMTKLEHSENHQTTRNGRQNSKRYLKRSRKLLETKLSCRNLIKGINTWAMSLVRYSGPFFKWNRDELKQMDQRTRS